MPNKNSKQNEKVVDQAAEQLARLFIEQAKYNKSQKSNTPKLINYNGTHGYKISDIKSTLNEEQFIKFQQWINGQTVMVYEGEDFIYEMDYLRFIKGLPALD